MDIYQESLDMHKKFKGKLEIKSKVPLVTRKDLSLAYTPGVAQACTEINKDPNKAYDYSIKCNSIAVISDGTAVLGLGNIGALASLPVMEGKAILFKEFANIDAYPLCIDEHDSDKLAEIIKKISVQFGAINLEDISAPRCFEVEAKLRDIGIPVFHDDQHGTAVVVLAALINAIKVTNKKFEDLKIVVNGAGAAGIAIAKILHNHGTNDIILCDTKGILYKDRDNLNIYKKEIVKVTNKDNMKGNLPDAMKDSDIFIGLSVADIVSEDMIKSMNPEPIILAMANPIPEIMPDKARNAGAAVIGTGRSDFPNQINNVLAFPGIIRGALDARAKVINEEMKLAAAQALANYLTPTKEKILPDPLDKGVATKIAEAVKQAAIESNAI